MSASHCSPASCACATTPFCGTPYIPISGVVPVFVLDAAILSGGFNRPNRAAFLADRLRDVDASLRARGAGLIIRGGDVVAETAKLPAGCGRTRCTWPATSA